ncbi:RILP-like protein 2 [Protobothrops mucrosquamatus]|uniref:RILP-like protein 2 n=1 Tax=Protobothrops mucrosquamatus TaxID=103944 RepID=UPI000775C1AD|nr:RILP-like protein 2 [Protobothrops mucrosquamatus]
MQAQQRCEEGEGEEEEEGGGGGGGSINSGSEGPFGKSPFHLTAEDVYDISYVLGRELHTLSTEPQAEVPARVARLQFKVVSILEMLEALVSENHLAVEALKMERESLKRELEELRQRVTSGTAGEVNLGPNKMIVDLTDVNRPRFTLQELKEVLQERNHLKAQLLFVQEELECYKSGYISQKQEKDSPTQREPTVGTPSGATRLKEKTTIKQWFAFKKLR